MCTHVYSKQLFCICVVHFSCLNLTNCTKLTDNGKTFQSKAVFFHKNLEDLSRGKKTSFFDPLIHLNLPLYKLLSPVILHHQVIGVKS